MELTKQHREALLTELEKAQKELELQSSCLDKQTDDSDLANWFEIGHFLAIQRVELIKKSIISSEIDY